MAFFKNTDEDALDYRILRDGGISLYRNPRYLEEDLQWLQRSLYRCHSIDCTTWISKEAMHDSLRDAFSFPEYYGKNLDAFRDCMSDLDVPDEGGVVIVLMSYDEYASSLGYVSIFSGVSEAQIILDILVETSRYMLLTGKRLITLVQSNDPLIRFENLGGLTAQWNSREWLNKDRGL